MKKIEVFIIIDVSATLASGHIQSNVCIVDTNRWIGSWSDDASTLHTVCLDRQSIGWRAQPVSLPEYKIIMVRNIIVTVHYVLRRAGFSNELCLSDNIWLMQVSFIGTNFMSKYGGNLSKVQLLATNCSFFVDYVISKLYLIRLMRCTFC